MVNSRPDNFHAEGPGIVYAEFREQFQNIGEYGLVKYIPKFYGFLEICVILTARNEAAVEKLIVTITCDSTISFPDNPHNPTPKGVAFVADEYVRCVEAGATIAHIHGPNVGGDAEIAEWRELRDRISSRCDALVQYGGGNIPLEGRRRLVAAAPPDMLAVCFNHHGIAWPGGRNLPPSDFNALHDLQEIETFCDITREAGVTIEIEAFHFGSIWNAQRVIEKKKLATPVWTSFLMGWPGSGYMPATPEALEFIDAHLPEGFIGNVSVMDPLTAWPVLATAIRLGWHVRVGMEDNPFVEPGVYAETNLQLVEKIVKMSREMGREIATIDDTRRILARVNA